MSTQYVGQRVQRIDGIQHVTGQTKYVNDLYFPGTHFIKALRAKVPSARIISIDTSRAEKVPGVIKVLTWKDVPCNQAGGGLPVFAQDEIRYIGQEIAAVVAVDEDTAQEAVGKIRVKIEERPAVLDPIKALEPGSPLVTPQGNFLYCGDKPCRQIRLGDVDRAFEEADFIVENYYRTQAQEHVPIETQCSVVEPAADGRFIIHSVTQAVWFRLGDLANMLQVPQGRLRMQAGVVGGGFGSKNDPHADTITLLAAYRTGKICKWLWTREEEFTSSTCRASTHMWYKDGVLKNGRIIARKIKTIRDGGAYVLTNDYVQSKHAYLAAGPYFIPNVWIDSYVAFTNKRPTSSMRGFGVFQASFAWETQMDHIAERLGMDPWEIRFINAHRNGEYTATHAHTKNVSLIECMKAVAEAAGVELPEHLLKMNSQTREV